MIETWNQISVRHRRRAQRGWALILLITIATIAIACCGPRRCPGAELKLEATIQAALDAKKPVDLATGDVLIAKGLTTGNVSGGIIAGNGCSGLIGTGHPLLGASTRLIATAKARASQTMITANGSHFAFRDFSIFGGTADELRRGLPRAKCGILVTKTAPGLGTGDHLIENLVLANLAVGVQAAEGVTENNCEKSVLRKVRFDRVGAGLLLKSQQAMGWDVDDCEWYDATDCIRVEGGGKVIGKNAFVHHEPTTERRSFLRIAPRDEEKSIGPNNGYYHFTGLYADQNAANLKLVSMRPTDDAGVRAAFYCSTTFDGFHISNESYTEPAIEVAGYSSTKLENGYGVQKEWVTWDNDPDGPYKSTSRVYLENDMIFDCKDGREVAAKAKARGWCHVIVRDCYDQFNRPIKDFNGELLGDRK